jgi:hypothetical protein
MFGMCTRPSARSKRAAAQRALRSRPTVGARALVVEGVEPALGQPVGGGDEEVRALAPGGDRVLLVEAADVHQVALEPRQRLLVREVRVHEPRPCRRRARRDRPVGRAVVDDLPRLLQGREAIAPDAGRVQVLHQPGSDRAGEPDARRADLPQREQPLAVPVGDEVEVLLARELDAGALDPRVEPLHVDELGTAAVRALRDRPDEVLLAGLAGDGDDLAGLHVGSEADDDVGEAAKRGVIHPAHLNRGVRCH